MMIRYVTRAGLALSLLSGLSVPMALASDGAVDAGIREKLTAQLVGEGYEVRQFKAEDGLIEVYVVKGGKMEELWFTADLKRVAHEEGEDE